MLADQDKFLALMEAHKGILYKVANAYCRNEAERQDLAQEIIIQLWQSFHRFDGRCLFSTWMYRVALNTAISYYRTTRRQTREAVSLEEVGLEVVAADPQLEAAGDDVRLLHQMIAQLDALNRALIILYLDGHSHEVMAEVVGLTPTNVATRLSRIKQKLQREYETKHNLQSGV